MGHMGGGDEAEFAREAFGFSGDKLLNLQAMESMG